MNKKQLQERIQQSEAAKAANVAHAAQDDEQPAAAQPPAPPPLTEAEQAVEYLFQVADSNPTVPGQVHRNCLTAGQFLRGFIVRAQAKGVK